MTANPGPAAGDRLTRGGPRPSAPTARPGGALPGLLVVIIDNTILNTALPALAEVLPAATARLQWITNAYTLCFAAMLITAGALGARYGHQLSLIGGLAVLALGGVRPPRPTSGTGGVIAARVVMGLGAAFVMPATLSISWRVFGRPETLAGHRRLVSRPPGSAS